MKHLRLVRTWLLSLIALVIVVLTSCERRMLEVVPDDRASIKIAINWRTKLSMGVTIEDSIAATKYFGGTPNGMTVMLWGRDTGQRYVRSSNGNSVSIALSPDTYYFVIFNEREDEFLPYMRFYNQESFKDANVRTTHYVPSRSYWSNDYIYYPDPIAVAVDSFQVTQDMVKQNSTVFIPYDEYVNNEEKSIIQYERNFEISEVATPMTVTLNLKLKVKRRQSMKTIQASLSGMADGFYLTRVDRTRESGTLEMDYKKWEYYAIGAATDSLGFIVNKTASFGLPYGKELLSERDSVDNVLKLRITLTNDKVQEYSFKVGKDLRYLTPEGHEAKIRYRDDLRNLQLEMDLKDIIILPPVPSSKTGFDAKVAEWDEGSTVDVGF